ncbi:MAG: ATPase, T2SS/T4P/T4SS family [Pseudomonadota bacterium]
MIKRWPMASLGSDKPPWKEPGKPFYQRWLGTTVQTHFQSQDNPTDFHQLLCEAIQQQASHIAFYFKPKSVKVYFRVYGCFDTPRRYQTPSIIAMLNAFLYQYSHKKHEIDQIENFQVALAVPVVNKAMGINETLVLQWTRCESLEGLHIVIKLIRTPVKKRNFHQLGLDAPLTTELQKIIASEAGMLLIVAPRGHGKSTTFAACIEALAPHRKVLTCEKNPRFRWQREHVLPMLRTANPDEKQNLRAQVLLALEQHIDVFGVSEMEDHDTADVAFHAANSGHFVIATLHANDAISAMQRLHEQGITYRQLGQPNVLKGILVQRLVDKLCEYCREPYEDAHWGCTFKRNPTGCEHCTAGVVGRLLVAEVLRFDDRARELLSLGDWIELENYFNDTTAARLQERCQEAVQSGWMDVEAFYALSNQNH